MSEWEKERNQIGAPTDPITFYIVEQDHSSVHLLAVQSTQLALL